MTGVTSAVRGEVLRALREPSLPGVRTAARTALVEVWYHPWPALAANVTWIVAVLLAVAVGVIWPLGGLLLAPFVALPVAGVMRVGARITRGEPVDVRHGFAAWRTHGSRALLMGVATTIVGLVAAADVVIGLGAMGGPAGWALATAAGWALLGGVVVLLHAWPLLMDPAAPDRSVGSAVRLAVRVALLFPGRAVALTAVAAVVLFLATVLFAVLATFAMAWIALLASAVVLPAADRLVAFEAGAGAAIAPSSPEPESRPA